MQNDSLDLMQYTAGKKPYVRVHSKADSNYFLSVRDGNLILAPFHQHDESQHWYKDERHSSIKDEEGRPFALVNKATGQAIKSVLKFNSPVVMASYNDAEVIEPSVLWTIGPDIYGNEGYKSLRPVGNYRLNMDAVGADIGAYDGIRIKVDNWTAETTKSGKSHISEIIRVISRAEIASGK